MQSFRMLAHLALGTLTSAQLNGCDTEEPSEPSEAETTVQTTGGAVSGAGGARAIGGSGGQASEENRAGRSSAGGTVVVAPSGGRVNHTSSGVGGSGEGGVETTGASAGGTVGSGGIGTAGAPAGGSNAAGAGGASKACTEENANCGCTMAEERACVVPDVPATCGDGTQRCGADGLWSGCELSPEAAAACDSKRNCNGYVGITYDDGPANTEAFVQALSDAGLVPVTFFVNGTNIARNPGAIAQMLTVGEVQSHAYTHTNLSAASVADVKSELEQNNVAIVAAGAPKPTIFRPPYGARSTNMKTATEDVGLLLTTWDVDSKDWNGASPAAIVSANERMSDGQVILMHENQKNSLAAIPQIAAALEAKGLCPGKLDPQTGKAVAP